MRRRTHDFYYMLAIIHSPDTDVALTGANSTSGFAGVGKKTALIVACSCVELLQDVGQSFTCSEETLQAAEKFVVSIYKKARCDNISINLLRHYIFCKSKPKHLHSPLSWRPTSRWT